MRLNRAQVEWLRSRHMASKIETARRLGALMMSEALHASGWSRSAADCEAAESIGVHPGTIGRWRALLMYPASLLPMIDKDFLSVLFDLTPRRFPARRWRGHNG